MNAHKEARRWSAKSHDQHRVIARDKKPTVVVDLVKSRWLWTCQPEIVGAGRFTPCIENQHHGQAENWALRNPTSVERNQVESYTHT
jgi:hypothetical protein